MADDDHEANLAELYDGQLDAVLSAWNEAMMKHLRYTNPLRHMDGQ